MTSAGLEARRPRGSAPRSACSRRSPRSRPRSTGCRRTPSPCPAARRFAQVPSSRIAVAKGRAAGRAASRRAAARADRAASVANRTMTARNRQPSSAGGPRRGCQAAAGEKSGDQAERDPGEKHRVSASRRVDAPRRAGGGARARRSSGGSGRRRPTGLPSSGSPRARVADPLDPLRLDERVDDLRVELDAGELAQLGQRLLGA